MIDPAFAALEHELGVLPLLDAFFAVGEADRKRASLGLFTPRPEPGLEAAAIAGEPSGSGLRLTGKVRLSSPDSEASIVLVKTGDEHRLAWLDHGMPGVQRHGTWLVIDGAVVDLVSRPVRISELAGWLETYAGAWALAAAMAAREGVRDLRRAARTTGFNASQWVAMGITEVEIEADLTLAAARRRPGIAVAAAAARTLSMVAAKTEELRDATGLELEGPLKVLASYLGGALFLENELARALHIGEARG
ncbi:MAG: hypothetical protein QOH06_5745 [Acidobacteriota bacterium]|nr:hypothetical protein [Acidobacteriota bacterium]